MYRLLIIEDDKLLAETLKECFDPLLYHITICHDGISGYKKARNNLYDLLIVDWLLPGKTGVDIIRNLRALSIETPALIITSRSSIHDIVAGLKCGSDGYLSKPFNLLEFKSRIDALLKRPPKTKSRIIKHGPISLNPEKSSIRLYGRSCIVRKKEYMILKYFMENPDIVLTRDQILNNVWTDTDDPFSSCVDVHINRIRDKIDKPFNTHLLQTVHGIGYKLNIQDYKAI